MAKQFETPAIIPKEVRSCIAVRMLVITFEGPKCTMHTFYKLLDKYYHGTGLIKSHMDTLLTWDEGGMYKLIFVVCKQGTVTN